MTYEKDRKIAHHLTRWRHLDYVAEGHIQVGISSGNLRPRLPQTHCLGLFLEIGVLSAGHFVQIYFRRARTWRAVKRQIPGAYRFPIIGTDVQGVQVKTCIAPRM